MSLITIIGVLLLAGALLYFIGTLPLNEMIKRIIHGVVILFVTIWLLQSMGIMPALGSLRIK